MTLERRFRVNGWGYCRFVGCGLTPAAELDGVALCAVHFDREEARSLGRPYPRPEPTRRTGRRT